MAKSSPWTPEVIAHLLRLDAVAASDPKITFKVMADRINEAFGTSFTRNSVAGRIRDCKLGGGYGPAGRQPRQAGQKPVEPQQAAPAPQQQPKKRKLVPPAPKPPLEPAAVKPSKPALPAPWLPPQEPPRSVHVTLIERGAGQCCWPVNDGGPFLYCGAAKRRPKNADDDRYLGYCEAHFAKLLGKPRQGGSARP